MLIAHLSLNCIRTGLRTKPVLAALLVLCVGRAAYAGPLSFEAAVGGAANHQDVTYIDFDGLLPTGVSLSFAGDGGIKTGTADWAAPYFLNNGAIFGEAPVNGPDASPYVSSGRGNATLAFTRPQRYFGLLWGSVDDYNTLSFYTWLDPIGAPSPAPGPSLSMSTGIGDHTYYVNVTAADPFDRVTAASTAYAFEFDDVAISTEDIAIPEPASVVLIGFGALVLLSLSRRQRTTRTS